MRMSCGQHSACWPHLGRASVWFTASREVTGSAPQLSTQFCSNSACLSLVSLPLPPPPPPVTAPEASFGLTQAPSYLRAQLVDPGKPWLLSHVWGHRCGQRPPLLNQPSRHQEEHGVESSSSSPEPGMGRAPLMTPSPWLCYTVAIRKG